MAGTGRTQSRAAPGGIGRRCVIAGAAMLARPAISRAALPLVLKLASGNGGNSPLGLGALAFAGEVARLSEGELKIDVFLDGALGGDQETFNAVGTGAVDFAIPATVGITEPVPSLGIFDIPFLFTDITQARSVIDGPLGQSYLAAAEPLGVTALAWSENGMRQLTNSRHPIRTPDDLKGLKLRVPQSQVMVKGFNSLGALTQGIALPLLYGALETGAFDGEENPITQIASARYYMVQKFLTCSAHIYSPGLLLASMERLASLSTAHQLVLRQAALAARQVSRAANDNGDRDGLVQLRQAGMEIIERIDRAAFVAALRPAYAEYDRMFGQATIDRLRG